MERSEIDQSELNGHPPAPRSGAEPDAGEVLAAHPVRSMVGRWSVDRYISLIRPWVIISGIIAVLLVLFRLNQIIVTVLQAVTCAWVGILVSRRHGQRIEAITAGAMAGLCLGLMTGLSRFILDPTGLWFINILFETIIFGLVGAMLSAGAQAAVHSKNNLSLK